MDAEASCPENGGAWDTGQRLGPRDREPSKKNAIKPWLQKRWRVAEPSAEYVQKMEDVLEVYTRPYDEKRPVVCLDETNRQLIGETREPRPVRPWQPAQYDYEYARNGVR